ncbi:MAG TPA: hypothetical protein VF731_14760 [Solirubrobacterales bacterium]
MELLAVPLTLLAIVLSTVALTTPHGRGLMPALFAMLVGSGGFTCLAAAHGASFGAAVAASGAAITALGLCLNVLRVDAHLAAEEVGLVPVLPAWSWLDRRRRWRSFEHHFWASVRAHASVGRPAGGAGEALYSFQRKGRQALFVMVRRDRDGQLLEASAYDPEVDA